jgi:hypothetical protein
MNQRWSIFLVCFLSGAICVCGQTQDRWERIYTGEEYVIEMNVSAVRLEPERILKAQFRTVLSEPEALKGTPETKYKTRLETIEFKLSDRQYRFSEISLLDPDGKFLQSYMSTPLHEWRDLKTGGVTERLFEAARSLPPFGTWKTVNYRFAETSLVETKPSQELELLIGTRVLLRSDRAVVGAKACTSPAFEDKRLTKGELFKDFGVELHSIGIQGDAAETVSLRCEASGWQPPNSLLIKGNQGELLMLWNGVFLVLRRDRSGTSELRPKESKPSLKRRQP